MNFGQQVAGQDRVDHWHDHLLPTIGVGLDIAALDPSDVTRAMAAALVGRAWAQHNNKTNVMDWDQWRAWFEHAGYSVNGVPARRPLRPVRLYRGGPHPEGWHWSSSVAVAVAHARGRHLWSAMVPPAALLCVVPFGPGDEHAVDPELLGEAPELVTDVRAARATARFAQVRAKLKAELVAEAKDATRSARFVRLRAELTTRARTQARAGARTRAR
jgi:hypothetical protein